MFFCDNKYAISLPKSEAHSSKGKYIDLNYTMFKILLGRGKIKVEFMPLIEMVSNPMSKRLLLDKFKWHVAAMELRNTFVVATWVSA
jgi:hypothetical protein